MPPMVRHHTPSSCFSIAYCQQPNISCSGARLLFFTPWRWFHRREQFKISVRKYPTYLHLFILHNCFTIFTENMKLRFFLCNSEYSSWGTIQLVHTPRIVLHLMASKDNHRSLLESVESFDPEEGKPIHECSVCKSRVRPTFYLHWFSHAVSMLIVLLLILSNGSADIEQPEITLRRNSAYCMFPPQRHLYLSLGLMY